MKALLVTTGSRGDVEPFIALARGLKAESHTPTLAAPARFRPLAAEHDINFVELDDGLLDLQDELAHQGMLAALTGVSKAKPALRRFLLDVADLEEHETDVVVYHPKTLAAPMVAEKLGVPALAVQLIPLFHPTTMFPAPILARVVPRWMNRSTWRLVSAIEAPWRATLREIRRDQLGLTTPLIGLSDQIRKSGTLNAWSPHPLPAPADWPASAAPLGFWRLPSPQWEPPQNLIDFLSAGEPPVYVGFGSMVTRGPASLGRAVLEGLGKTGRRGIVATGSGALELESTDEILVMNQAPHEWLLPRVSVVVHHGGIGTVAAALCAGVPQVIKPFLGDQPFWARHIESIGAGVSLRSLTPDAFAHAVTRALDRAPRCRDLAKEVAKDDGMAAAIKRIEHATGL